MTDVPRVGNVAGTGGVVHHLADLFFGIAAENDVHIADVSRIHTDKKVIFVVVRELQLNRLLAIGRDAVLFKLGSSLRVDRLADTVDDFFCTRDRKSVV